jgi:hypothetical protein
MLRYATAMARREAAAAPLQRRTGREQLMPPFSRRRFIDITNAYILYAI